MKELLWVAAGGAIGASLRFGVYRLLEGRSEFPWATLAVNVFGCLVIGLLYGLEWIQPDHPRRFFLAVGILGSLTTFSAFGYEAWKLLQDQKIVLMGFHVFLNVSLGFLGVAIGHSLGRGFST